MTGESGSGSDGTIEPVVALSHAEKVTAIVGYPETVVDALVIRAIHEQMARTSDEPGSA